MTRPIDSLRQVDDAPWRGSGVVALGGGIAVIAYWTLFFSGAIEGAPPGGLVHEFELAFPVADTLLAATAIAAGVALLRRARQGVFLLAAAGAMSLYLGVLDMSFYTRQGLYWPPSAAGGFEFVVNAICVFGGAFGLRMSWRMWDEPVARAVPIVDIPALARRRAG